ncbi:MAG: NAD(P)H-dependent oxidoreductase [Acidaminococcaceae bacterium]|nr:NAD(P)H-dependent oxidoreductase [Acidaminococcaceae bacterium]
MSRYNMLKRGFLGIMVLILLTGCGKQATSTVSATAGETKKTGKVLIAYYSYSKDHNTKAVAEQIKGFTSGDIVEITPKTPYSTDYDKTVEQGHKEVQEGFQPEITTKVANWDQYDTIIIGSPIWWYHVAPPVSTFMHKNNFQGKNVAVFVTHGGYGGGESAKDLEQGCKGAKILGAYAAPGASVQKDKLQVEEWLKKIGVSK